MKIEKPMCNFQNCKYHQDGNCVNASRYENCKVTDLHSEIVRLRVDLDNAIADTVKRMQVLLYKKANYKVRGYYCVSTDDIDETAKEIINEKTHSD
jgi:hypothetical protein